MKKTATLVIIIIILLSCKKESQINNVTGAKEIDMTIGRNSKNFCELVDDIKFIRLETSEESLIGTIERVKIENDRIFVHDYKTQSILIFSYPDGKFLNKIRSIGNGPGEYTGVFDFNIIENQDCVMILDGNLRKLFKYRFDGSYVSSKRIPFFSRSFLYLDSQNLLFNNYSLDDKKYAYKAIITDTTLTIKNSFFEIERFYSFQMGHGNQTSKRTDDSALFLPQNSVIAYKVTKDSIVPRYFFNFKDRWNEDILYQKADGFDSFVFNIKKKELVYGLGMNESTNFIIADFWTADLRHLVVYNKNNENLNYINNTKNGFVNNKFVPKGYYQDYLLTTLDHEHIKRALTIDKDCYFNEKAKKTVDNLNDNDNPVLVLTKFKN
ncbi:6-bladed beta-propeller [Tenacibaculum tangerinum]|uniref:6-bladed beta-propeller n=1 Tax=Tenacibaculum tangerinum TaxID=3038772 RepID=A0ABY8KXZ9_9FLAO|nr:6-bladed beta-propeller [Tenacibaculum tangerinum]WGH74124.1 6-bladed beta-propeller [Tenacibaculum tangerinum]